MRSSFQPDQDFEISQKTSSLAVKSPSGALNDIADYQTWLVCQIPASIKNYDDSIVPKCLGKYFSLLLIFMLSTFVLSVTICILIVIAILWFNAQPCPNEDLESKQNGSGQKEVISRKEISKAF